MSLTLGNGFGNFKRPLNLRKDSEKTQQETNTPEIKGGMKAEKPQAVNSIEYTAKAPSIKNTPTEPNIREGGSNGNSTFGDLYGEEPSLPDTTSTESEFDPDEFWAWVDGVAAAYESAQYFETNIKPSLIHNNFNR